MMISCFDVNVLMGLWLWVMGNGGRRGNDWMMYLGKWNQEGVEMGSGPICGMRMDQRANRGIKDKEGIGNNRGKVGQKEEGQGGQQGGWLRLYMCIYRFLYMQST